MSQSHSSHRHSSDPLSQDDDPYRYGYCYVTRTLPDGTVQPDIASPTCIIGLASSAI